MSRNTIAAALLIICGLLFAGRSAGSKFPLPGIDDRWRYFNSPNFELYSQDSEPASRDLLYQLETVRAVFLENMKLQERIHLDVCVFYFRSRNDFLGYVPENMRNNSALAGFYFFSPDRAVIVMAPADDSDVARQTIFHEYIHHLFRVTELDPPLWFNEGTADLFAGIHLERDRVQIGPPLEIRALYLREQLMLPLDEVFAADHNSKLYTSDEHNGVFYAESWALLHFLRFGECGFTKDAVERFLRVAGNREAAARTDLRKFTQSCFGCDYRELQYRLNKYIRTGTYHTAEYPKPSVPKASSYGMRGVPVDEASVRLADLAVRVTHSAAGKLMLLNALDSRPNDPQPLETLGMEAFHEGDENGAVERWEQALAKGSRNPAIIRELALMEGRRWTSDFEESKRLPEEILARLRTRLLRSIQAEPAQGAAYEMLAWVEAFAGVPNAENVNLIIQHLPSLADKRHTLTGLAWLMVRIGHPKNADLMLDDLEKARLDPLDAEAVFATRARFDAEFPEFRGKKPDNSAEIVAPPDKPGLKMPSAGLPDDL